MYLPNPKHKVGYTLDELRDVLNLNGRTEEDFNKFFQGQTCSLDDDGNMLIYPYDVERFLKRNYRLWD